LTVKVSTVAKGDVPRTQADTARAREVLGWIPDVEFESGLAQHVTSIIG
jgi:nucleoside-diphosphate-sugar epimerase